MKSRILTGQVLHTRLTPVRHRFSYPVYFYSFDLEELPQLAAQTRLFGYNRRAVVSIFDEDYLTPGQVPVKEKLFSILKDQVELDELCSIELITCARYFGYVFNPVSFFMCRDRAGRLRCVLAEVNNTFSETHLYVLDKAEQSKADDLYVFRAAKEFHVSPFYGMDWKYVFRVKDTGKKLAIDIDMVRDAKAEFHARLEGEAAPFGAHELRTTLFRFPFTALLSFPRIL
ncbi:MAG TPA: DUF1365 domain-containing protein, partial [Oligoflexia bacterium]|nr:DUF1365 domain-containing protein [Oligoflexia bacterium]